MVDECRGGEGKEGGGGGGRAHGHTPHLRICQAADHCWTPQTLQVALLHLRMSSVAVLARTQASQQLEAVSSLTEHEISNL